MNRSCAGLAPSPARFSIQTAQFFRVIAFHIGFIIVNFFRLVKPKTQQEQRIAALLLQKRGWGDNFTGEQSNTCFPLPP